MIFVLERASRSSSRVRRILNAFPRDTHCSYVKKKKTNYTSMQILMPRVVPSSIA